MNKDTLFNVYIPTIFRSLENFKLASEVLPRGASEDRATEFRIEDCLELALFCFNELLSSLRKGITVTLLMSMGFPIVCGIHPSSVDEFKVRTNLSLSVSSLYVPPPQGPEGAVVAVAVVGLVLSEGREGVW